jgi:hypothetical protein
MWLAMRRQHSSMPIGGVVPLAPGTTLDDVAQAVRFILGRHESLRTRLGFHADGRPYQVLADRGELRVPVLDADGVDPADLAEQVRVGFRDTEYDYAEEWPVRAAVIRHEGRPDRMVATYCHLALDAHGMRRLLADLTTMGPGPATPVTGLPPLAQARWQNGPDGRAHCDNALRRWERVLRAIPPRRFRDSTDRRHPRHWQARWTSPAAHLAVRTIAARLGVDTGPVLLAAFAVALHRVTGIHPIATQLMVSNRFRRDLADSVSTVSQPSLCLLDIAGLTFDAAVRQAWQASLGSYKCGYYDPEARDALRARVEADRGEPVDIACFFNDRRLGDRPADTGPVDPAAIRAALPASTLRWEHRLDRSSERLFVHVNDAPDTVDLGVCADTHYVSPGDVETFVAALEDMVVRAAVDPAARTGVDPAHSH